MLVHIVCSLAILASPSGKPTGSRQTIGFWLTQANVEELGTRWADEGWPDLRDQAEVQEFKDLACENLQEVIEEAGQ